MASSPDTREEALFEQYAAHGQGHVFRFWRQLDAAQRAGLARQAAAIDLPRLLRELAATRAERSGPVRLEPVPVERSPAHGGDAQRLARACEVGEALLAEGRVAALVVAGGQATRLGFDGPKGAYPIGPVSSRCLFEIQAQKLRRLARRYGRPVPWYVMTSEATDAATRALFEASDHFGVPRSEVFFFRQGMVPSFDFDDRMILAAPDRIAENPDGHGGSLTALLASGALDDMEARGVSTLFYYQVDNPLVRMADPVYLGLHRGADAEMSCKVVRKVDPMEKAGVVARANGVVSVVEYTELDDEHRHARDASGELRFWAGNTAIHVFEVAFARRVACEAERWLPFHASEKKVPGVDDQGRPTRPEAPNARKLERFVFDALAAAERVCVVETDREVEFAPVKNAEGVDSPETARRALVAQYRRWLEAAGLPPPRGVPIELDHSQIDGPEDALALDIRNPTEAPDIISIAPGVDA